MSTLTDTGPSRVPWNDRPEATAEAQRDLGIRVRVQLSSRVRDLAMFNLAIESKLRACDLTKLRVRGVCRGEHVASRATIMQHKAQRPYSSRLPSRLARAWRHE